MVVFLGVALGPRPALVVSIAIPLTLALTLFTSMIIGYTINRVTLFALIFSIGILVDDAIVVVENTYRHLKMRLRPHDEASIHAVDKSESHDPGDLHRHRRPPADGVRVWVDGTIYETDSRQRLYRHVFFVVGRLCRDPLVLPDLLSSRSRAIRD